MSPSFWATLPASAFDQPQFTTQRKPYYGNVRRPNSLSLSSSPPGTRGRLPLQRVFTGRHCHEFLGAKFHWHDAKLVRRRALPCRPSLRDGEGRTHVIHRIAPLLNLNHRRNPMQKTLLIGYLGKDPEMKYTPGGTAITTFTMASTECCKYGVGEPQEH